MKPSEILADDVSSVERDGVVVRKGTIGAFTSNIGILERTSSESYSYHTALSDMFDLVPALEKLNFFDFYDIKSSKVRSLLKERFPHLPIS